MKRFLLIIFLLNAVCFLSNAQTVNVEYLNPMAGNSSYKYLKFGTLYYGGMMYNINSPNYGDGDDFAIYANYRDLVFQAFDKNIIMFPNFHTGKVGIGKTDPTAFLSIRGRYHNRVFDGYSYSNKLMFQFNTEYGYPIFQLYDMDGATVDIKLDTQGDSYFNGGNVGIGTDTPDDKLHIYNNSGITRQYIENPVIIHPREYI